MTPLAQKLYHKSNRDCLADADNGPKEELANLIVARPDADGRGFTAFSKTNITRHHFTRLNALPEACAKVSTSNDPIENFESVWQNFSDHYAFFPDHGVDWHRTYLRFRPQVTATTTPDQLYAILTTMFDTLNDRHVTLNRPGFDQYRSGLGPVVMSVKRIYDPLPAAQKTGLVEYLIGALEGHKKLINDRYADGRVQSAANGQIAWGKIGDLGYLRFDSEYGFAAEANYAAEVPVLAETMEKAFKDFAGTRGVILDLRFTLGGNDRHGLAIAGRFTDRAYTAYSKYALDQGRWTAPQALTVQPTGANAYTRPVYLLTSNVTVSGGENLTLAMMGRPGVTRIGETTAGAYADQLTKPMPNGWSYTISNEVFEGIDGRIYEARGIPADIVVANSVLLSQETRDPVLERVISLASQSSANANRRGQGIRRRSPR